MKSLFRSSWLLSLFAVWVCGIHANLAGPMHACNAAVAARLPKTQDFDPACSAGLSSQEIEDGWIALFDGKTFFGWKSETAANWRITDGRIIADGGSTGLLRTTSQFDDFELRVEFKASVTTNSGIFLRTSPNPRNPTDDCIELNIAPPDNPFPTGSLVGRKKSTPLAAPELWHKYRIVAKGKQIQVWIDNQESVTHLLESGDVAKGYIGLQFRSGPVEFRNLYLRPLGIGKLFNGQDLVGWNTNLAEQSKFRVTARGELQIENGPGQIESDTRFGDFVFQTHCRTNETGLNSGVFFRCVPGQMMNGYESQIQNQFRSSDPTKPADCGTGGLFRRQNARRVNAADKLWFAKTIIAVGPHVSVWVNGYQVVDWTDKRRPDDNPRQGLRLQPGTIILQGHDPTTDILFRQIQAREIRPRRFE